jgi:sialate O-acetylesterase
MFLWSVLVSPICAEPMLPHLFSDHMVFQRDSAIRVWGWADPGERISASLGANTKSVNTNSQGNWRIDLPAMGAGGPFVLRVQGKKSLEFKDVLIGEVWVASGQSNMTFALNGATGGNEAISKADYDEIRFLSVPQKISLTPQRDISSAEWVVCSPETAKTFSAVSYFFARDLYQALRIPVGIILSARPGTAAEEWTDPESLRTEPALRSILAGWDNASTAVKSLAAGSLDFSLEFDDFELLPQPGDGHLPTRLSDFDDGTSRTATGGDWT